MMSNRNRLGTFRAYWLAMVICLAAFMQGYDSGVAGGVLTMKPFRRDYRYAQSEQTRVNSLSVGLQNLGSFLASFAIFPFTAKYGRRLSIMVSSAIFCLGALIETINTHSLYAWYISRVVAGIGQGGCSVVVPAYCAEMAPKEIRGRLGSLYQWMYTLGICVSYWCDYAVVRSIPNVSQQWQIPVGIQILAGGLLFLGMFTVKESVRWLVKQKRAEEAWKSLIWIRADDGAVTASEYEEIRRGISDESQITEGVRLQDLLEPANRYRLFLASMIFLFQQGTGATALAYFGPQFFKLLVGPGDMDLLLTGLFGAVKVVACSVFIIFLSERFGRRVLLLSGGLVMAACMFSTALVYKYLPPPGDGQLTPAGIATVALLFINIVAYNWSWGTVPWIYVAEIFPTRIRDVGMAVGLSIHWLFSFVFSISTPYMIQEMQWGIFLFYAALDSIMVIFSWFLVKETRGESLERMAEIFEGKKCAASKADGSEHIEDISRD